MADLSVLAIVILGITLLEPLHEFSQGRLATFEQQMDMIGHQAVGVNRDIVLAPILRESFQIGLIVGWTEKSLLSLFAAHDNVIGNANDNQPGLAGHTAVITTQ